MGLAVLSVLCLLFASGWAQTADPTAWNSFYVKYGTYISMPKTEHEATNGSKRFVLVPEMDHAGSSEFATMVKLYCLPNDPRVCPMYRKTDGILAGLRVSFIKQYLTEKKDDLLQRYNFLDIPMFKESNMFGKPAFAAEILFINPVNLNSRMIEHPGEVADGIWLKLNDNKMTSWMKMERDESNATNGGFTKQACLAEMGMHYFYQMRKGLDCTKVQPVFMLYNKNKLVGMGIVPWGGFSKEDEMQWFEDVPGLALRAINPFGPSCLTDWHSTYGVTSLHIYFVEKPKEISCSLSQNPVFNVARYYLDKSPLG